MVCERRRPTRPAPNHSSPALFVALSIFLSEKSQNLPACSELVEEPKKKDQCSSSASSLSVALSHFLREE